MHYKRLIAEYPGFYWADIPLHEQEKALSDTQTGLLNRGVTGFNITREILNWRMRQKTWRCMYASNTFSL